MFQKLWAKNVDKHYTQYNMVIQFHVSFEKHIFIKESTPVYSLCRCLILRSITGVRFKEYRQSHKSLRIGNKITPRFMGWYLKGQDKAIHPGFNGGSCQWVFASCSLFYLFYFPLQTSFMCLLKVSTSTKCQMALAWHEQTFISLYR